LSPRARERARDVFGKRGIEGGFSRIFGIDTTLEVGGDWRAPPIVFLDLLCIREFAIFIALL
jgi:hypothetical protein